MVPPLAAVDPEGFFRAIQNQGGDVTRGPVPHHPGRRWNAATRLLVSRTPLLAVGRQAASQGVERHERERDEVTLVGALDREQTRRYHVEHGG